jgi:hypothetical protein
MNTISFQKQSLASSVPIELYCHVSIRFKCAPHNLPFEFELLLMLIDFIDLALLAILSFPHFLCGRPPTAKSAELAATPSKPWSEKVGDRLLDS